MIRRLTTTEHERKGTKKRLPAKKSSKANKKGRTATGIKMKGRRRKTAVPTSDLSGQERGLRK